jgi:signal peptidase I
MKNLPKSFKENKWSYGDDTFTFNGINYKSESIKASEVKIGDVIVVTNGWRVIGIGEVIDVKRDSTFNKYREIVPLKYINTNINLDKCSSHGFSEELDRVITKIIL